MHKVNLKYDGEVISQGEAHYYSDALQIAIDAMPAMYVAIPEDVRMECTKPNGKIIRLPLSIAGTMPDNLDYYKAEAAMKRIDSFKETTKWPE